MHEWIETQQRLGIRDRWIMGGDLGPYDALATRLAAADTVLVLDFSLMRCLWRAARRSWERADFWWWTVLWRRRSRPGLMDAIAHLEVRRTGRGGRARRGVTATSRRLGVGLVSMAVDHVVATLTVVQMGCSEAAMGGVIPVVPCRFGLVQLKGLLVRGCALPDPFGFQAATVTLLGGADPCALTRMHSS